VGKRILRNSTLTRKQYMRNIKLLITFLIIGFTINISGQDGTGLDGDSNADANIGVYTGKIEQANASARLLVAMALTAGTPLNFGSLILTGTTASSVTYDPTKTDVLGRDYTGTITASTDNGGGTPSLARFTLTGGSGEGYALSLPSTITLTHASFAASVAADETMSISDLKVKFGNSAITYGTGTGRVSALSTSGTDDLTIGGKLNVTASQKAGPYTGTYEISVNYN
jgi:hypothetical protein